MKALKKWIGILLCLAMLLSLGAMACADEEAETATTADSGIIDADELQKMFDDFTAQYNMKATGRSFSVGFCYLATGDTWYYNTDKWYYSASLYKVPVSMLLAEKVANGEMTMSSQITSMYMSGTLETLMSKALINSNNDAGHALVDACGGTYAGKCADQLYQFTDLDKSYFSSDFESVSYYNVEFYTQVLKTLYENPNRFPYVIDYMKQAQPGAYLRTYLEGKYDIAQKYGAFEETKTSPTKQNNHAAGIIYTPNPIIVTVMTVNIDNYNNRIGEVAQMLTDYALTLDSRLAAYNQEQQLAAQQEAERAAKEEQEHLAAEAAAAAAAAANTTDTQSTAVTDSSAAGTVSTAGNNTSIFLDTTPTPAAVNSSSSSGASGGMFGLDSDTFQRIILIAGAAIFVLGVLLLIVALTMRHRRKRDEEYDDYYDDADANDDDYLAPPVVKKSSKGRKQKAIEDEDDRYDEEYDDFTGVEGEEDYIDNSDEPYADDESYAEDDGEFEYEDAPADENAEEYLEGEEDYLEQDKDFLDAGDYDDIRNEFETDDTAYDDVDDSAEEPAEEPEEDDRKGGKKHRWLKR